MIDLLIIYKIIIILIKNRYVNILKTLNFKMFIMDFNNQKKIQIKIIKKYQKIYSCLLIIKSVYYKMKHNKSQFYF